MVPYYDIQSHKSCHKPDWRFQPVNKEISSSFYHLLYIVVAPPTVSGRPDPINLPLYLCLISGSIAGLYYYR